MTNFSHIADNIKRIRAQIAETAVRSGRQPDDIKLIAVTKTYPTDYVQAAVDAGLMDAGENRVQEAVPKIEEFSAGQGGPPNWHLIGHLQSNKAKLAVQYFDLIHSIDSLKLAQAVNKHAEKANKLKDILIQINVSGEESKSGLGPLETKEVLTDILNLCPHLIVRGFMTMAPHQSAEAARPHFKALRELRDDIISKINHERLSGKELSMGMSNDFLVAVEEGSTMVRIGSAIFGERDYR